METALFQSDNKLYNDFQWQTIQIKYDLPHKSKLRNDLIKVGNLFFRKENKRVNGILLV